VATKNKIVAFAAQHNTKGVNPRTGVPWRDATHAFIPEARAFMQHHKQPSSQLYMVDNTKSAVAMRSYVLQALEQEARSGNKVRGVAFFCHGFKSGIQFGFRMLQAESLARTIAEHATEDVRVTFYACDAARDNDNERSDDLLEFGGDDGFADHVRDYLCAAGATKCVVDAHTTAGHTTMNPDVRRFEGLGSPVGGVGGYYLVPREKRKLFAAWRKALRTDLRFDFPFMGAAEVHKRLAAGL
jgi:hypothetical protein